MNTMICNSCYYQWIPRVKNPKECPRCKARLDFTPKTKNDGYIIEVK